VINPLLRIFPLLFLCALCQAQAAEEKTGCDSAGCRQTQDGTWVDDSYEYVTSRTDSLAVWLDSFFGTPTADLDSADSILRLRFESEWDQDDGVEQKVRVRGKLDLPAWDRRLSLVFSEDDEDREALVPNSAAADDDVGLQYQLSRRERSRLYFTVGSNSSLDLKAALRYRYVYPIGENWRARFDERIYYKQDEGFGAITRGDLDYRVNDNRIVRWNNQVEYGEETEGLEWGTRLSYQLRLNEKEALSYFAGVSGETDPEFLDKGYSLGLSYRRNIFRRWIFIEVEPSQQWRKDAPGESRQSVSVLTLRLEFTEDLQNRRGVSAEARADD
jgi:hypothetical protein